MATPDAKAIQILGGSSLLKAGLKKALRKKGPAKKLGGTPGRPSAKTVREAGGAPDALYRDAVKIVVVQGKSSQVLEPGELGWTKIIRSGLPAKSTKTLAGMLRLSVTDLAESLRLPARTVHRRLEKGETLTPEESERSIRAARALAKAQEFLGDENGRGWVLSPCRGLGGEVPLELLDTADGFTAVMDELGRLEHGVLS